LRTPGRVSLRKAFLTSTFASAPITVSPLNATDANPGLVAVSSTNLHDVAFDGTLTDKGAHGLGAAPSSYAMCRDGKSAYFSPTTAGTVGVRKWDHRSTWSTHESARSSPDDTLSQPWIRLVAATSTYRQYGAAVPAGLLIPRVRWLDAPDMVPVRSTGFRSRVRLLSPQYGV
jgi:hypothetical protein